MKFRSMTSSNKKDLFTRKVDIIHGNSDYSESIDPFLINIEMEWRITLPVEFMKNIAYGWIHSNLAEKADTRISENQV